MRAFISPVLEGICRVKAALDIVWEKVVEIMKYIFPFLRPRDRPRLGQLDLIKFLAVLGQPGESSTTKGRLFGNGLDSGATI